MKNKKLTLKTLSIASFITGSNQNKTNTIKGGKKAPILISTDTICYENNRFHNGCVQTTVNSNDVADSTGTHGC